VQKTDILFVIDNSGSMGEEQEGVARELPEFIRALRAGGGLEQDFRVGVVTTSVYLHSVQPPSQAQPNPQPTLRTEPYADQAGRLRPVPNPDGTFAAAPPRWLEGTDPSLDARFALLVRQGVSGSGQETAFEAAYRAVTPPLSTQAPGEPPALGGNAGFLRDGARLLVVVVTDEDDCSERAFPPRVVLGTEPTREYCTEQANELTPVAEYAELFRALTDSTGAPRQVLWTSIAPVARADKRVQPVIETGAVRNVDCPTSFGAGARHRQMASLFEPSLRNLDSICRATYRDTLLTIAAIANETQELEVTNVPDGRLLQVAITRAGGEVVLCTQASGLLQYEAATEAGQRGRILFSPGCARRFDDVKLEVRLLCAD
jgi:hypothetical protein